MLLLYILILLLSRTFYRQILTKQRRSQSLPSDSRRKRPIQTNPNNRLYSASTSLTTPVPSVSLTVFFCSGWNFPGFKKLTSHLEKSHFYCSTADIYSKCICFHVLSPFSFGPAICIRMTSSRIIPLIASLMMESIFKATIILSMTV